MKKLLMPLGIEVYSFDQLSNYIKSKLLDEKILERYSYRYIDDEDFNLSEKEVDMVIEIGQWFLTNEKLPPSRISYKYREEFRSIILKYCEKEIMQELQERYYDSSGNPFVSLYTDHSGKVIWWSHILKLEGTLEEIEEDE